jgi:hypothetical protein
MAVQEAVNFKVVGSSPTPGAMNEEFDSIIERAYEEAGTLDRQLSDVISVTRVPEDAKMSVMYLAEFVSSMPGMEVWGTPEDPLNPELTELFEPFAFPEESWREAVAVGSEFGVLRARMFGNGDMISIEVRPNYVPFCVENKDYINAMLAAVSFNQIRDAIGDPDLEAYQDDHIAALGVFGGWRDLAYACIEKFTEWGNVAVNMDPIMTGCCRKYNLGDIKEHPWLFNSDAVWSILKDVGLFSGTVQAAELRVDSAMNLCILGGNFELADKIASVFDV